MGTPGENRFRQFWKPSPVRAALSFQIRLGPSRPSIVDLGETQEATFSQPRLQRAFGHVPRYVQIKFYTSSVARCIVCMGVWVRAKVRVRASPRTAHFWQSKTAQRLPPPWLAHSWVAERALLVHPSCVQRRPPPCAMHRRLGPTALFWQPADEHRFAPPCATQYLGSGELCERVTTDDQRLRRAPRVCWGVRTRHLLWPTDD